MESMARVCIACGEAKGEIEFDRVGGGSSLSPTCRACLLEQERLRIDAAAARVREAQSVAGAEGVAALVEETRALRREVRDLRQGLERWELYHHPIRSVAFGLVAGGVVMSCLWLVSFLGWLLVVGGHAGSLAGGTNSVRVVGVLAAGAGAAIVLGVMVWMVRLLGR
jgi:hypothetical protein